MMKTRILCFFILIWGLFLTVPGNAISNNNIVDPTFNAQLQTSTYLSKTVRQLISLPDGKILALGKFNNYNGHPVGSLIRLRADGSLDTAFNNGLLEIEPLPEKIVVRPDGKIILFGSFTFTDGTNYTNKVVRLNEDGTLDATFNYPYSGHINTGFIDKTGRTLVSGIIQIAVDGGSPVYEGLIRLNENGTLDPSFNAPSAGFELNFSVQSDDKIVYPQFDNAAQQYRVFRLNEDGSADNTFTSALIGGSYLLDVKAQADNKILILASNRIFRLNENGSIDADFQSTLTFTSGQPTKILLHGDGRITLSYPIVSSSGGARVIRLLSNGAADPSFTPYNFSYSYVWSDALQIDAAGGVLIGDQSTNSSSNGFLKLLPSGLVDVTFNAGASGFQHINPGKIRTIKALPDGKILIGGDFDKVNNVERNKIARLNADSTLDTTFQIQTNGTGNYFSQIGEVYHFAVQNDGKIIISGRFGYFVNGVQKFSLVRINSDGSIDPTFNFSLLLMDYFLTSGLGKNKPVQTPDGKILVGTTRTMVSEPVSIPLLLKPDGSRDTSFNPTIYNTQDSVTIFDLMVQPDGKILIAGRYEKHSISGSTRKGFIARLNSDGTVDQSFQSPELVDKSIFVIDLRQNNQIITASGTNQQTIVSRLNPDGSYDTSFISGAGANGRINAISILPDNKILVGGSFTTFNNQPRRNLALLNANGTLAQSLGNVNREVMCITLDNQGRALIGGSFTFIGNSPQNSAGAGNFTSESSASSSTRSYLARLIISPVTTNRTKYDFDGDGKSDISVFRPADGTWYLNRSGQGFASVQFGIASDKLVPEDYDGDGITDLAVFRDGSWHLLRSQTGLRSVQFGSSEDVPQPADFDGDGRAELAVFRPSNGTWYILNLIDNQFTALQFGTSGDKPVASDYDGDGRADHAVFRPSNGTWYLLRSQQGFTALQFGISTDRAVPADYDGDGRTDPAVYRDGTWYLLRSGEGFTGIQFGLATDLPVPADYDGDGKTDIAVFRNGNWYLLRSTQGYSGQIFGAANDRPLQNSFVP